MPDTFIHSPLLIAVLAMLFAQFIKVPIHLFFTKKWNLSLMFSTGGMPSSHSAMVAALATSIGIDRGFGDDRFALASVFALIVMYDALGIRRQAGKQATILNQLVKDVQQIVSTLVQPDGKEDRTVAKRHLKELLGHEPLEVFFGAVLGVLTASGLSLS